MEYLFSAWQEISAKLTETESILLLSDYDGTLSPIAKKPDLANMPSRTKQLLSTLARQKHFAVGIISGRSLDDIRKKTGIDGITYVGNHGLEIEGPDVSFVVPHSEEIKRIIQSLNHTLTQIMKPIEGVLVENKGLSISIHYRMAAETSIGEIESALTRATDILHTQGKFKLYQGKKTYELRPATSYDKGKAVTILTDRYRELWRRGSILSIFMGDDLTDENGFKVINENGGISIFVGEKNSSSAAHYFLKSPLEVEQFLNRLLNTRA
ncbi:MAG: trehalose-phosphatase [Dehalococcoidia bacterium]|nr:trehalose-phosphatase [Dehalococcoidia bacterium]